MAAPSSRLRTLLLSPSTYDQVPDFRDKLRRATHQGLTWTGLVGLGGVLSHVLLGVLLPGTDVTVLPGPEHDPSTLLLFDDFFNAGVSVLCLVLAWRRCSLYTGRCFAAGALLLVAAVTLFDDALYGDLQNRGFLLVIYMLAVAAVPFRPWQVLALGGGIGGLMLSMGPLGLLPDGLPLLKQLPLLGVVTALMTGVTVTLYGTRWAEYQARRQRTDDRRENEEWLRSITQNLSDGLYRSTPNDGLVYANEAFAALFGYDDPDALLDVDPTTLYADPAQRASITAQLEEQGHLDREEVEFRRRDGSTFVGLLSSTAVSGEDGTVQYYDGMVVDITERKERERQLQRERDRFTTLFNHFPNPVAYGTVNDDGLAVRAVNAAFERTFETDLATIEADHLHEHVLLPTGHRDRAALRDRIRQTGDAQVEVRRPTADGPRDFQVHLAVRASEDTAPEGYAIYTDITERKRREAQLRDRRAKVEDLYAATGNLLRAKTHEEVAAQIESIVTDTLDYPLSLVRFVDDGRLYPGRSSPSLHDHMPERPVYDVTGASPVARAFRSGETLQFDDVQRAVPALDVGEARATAYVPIEGHGVISVSDLDPGTIDAFDVRLLEILAGNAAVVLDRTLRVQELVTAKKQAEESNRLKSAFLANMSHEIRTPLTSIIGFAEAIGDTLARSDGPASDHPTLRFARLIEKSGRRLLDTLNSVLDLSQLEAGSVRLAPQTIDVRAELADALDLFAPQAESNGIEMVADLPDRPLLVRADEGALQRILHNLLSNAVKFTERGGSVVVRAKSAGEAVVVEVEDTGIGIDPAFQADLFDPFKQGSTGTDRSHEGSGLGLAVTKQLVDHIGGTVEVDSTPGEGSTFRLRLPTAEDA